MSLDKKTLRKNQWVYRCPQAETMTIRNDRAMSNLIHHFLRFVPINIKNTCHYSKALTWENLQV